MKAGNDGSVLFCTVGKGDVRSDVFIEGATSRISGRRMRTSHVIARDIDCHAFNETRTGYVCKAPIQVQEQLLGLLVYELYLWIENLSLSKNSHANVLSFNT